MTSLQVAYEMGVKLAMQEAGLVKEAFGGGTLLSTGVGSGVGALASGEQNRGRGALIGGGTMLGADLGARAGMALAKKHPLVGLAGLIGGGVAGNIGGRAVAPARMESSGWQQTK